MTTQEIANALVAEHGSRRAAYLCVRPEPECVAWRAAQPYSLEELAAVGEYLLWHARSGATQFDF